MKMCKAIVVMAQTVVMVAHAVPFSVDGAGRCKMPRWEVH